MPVDSTSTPGRHDLRHLSFPWERETTRNAMTLDWTRTLLLWDPEDSPRFGLNAQDFRSQGLMTLDASYERIGKDPELAREIRSTGCQAVIFTRNDDMEGSPPIGELLRDLCLGYTAASAIDPEHQEHQTRKCLKDLLNKKGTIDIPDVVPVPAGRKRYKGTFSLIFDLEQLGGACFGMPRLLPLIESRGVRATFFVTGFISEIYPALIRRIAAGGHEIAAHGSTHEFLQGRPLEEQKDCLRANLDHLRGFGEIRGANFIFRMDHLSPAAIKAAGLDYLVLFRKHFFSKGRFLPASVRPRIVRTSSGDIAMIPVSAETYGLSREEIMGMLKSAWNMARREGVNHMSLLMHPFKDGALRRLDQVGHLIGYLMNRVGLRPVTLSELPGAVSPPENAARILYRWDGNEADAGEIPGLERKTASWWAPTVYHSARTENLADALERAGLSVVLCGEAPLAGRRIFIYPDRWREGGNAAFSDPVLRPEKTASEVLGTFNATDSVNVFPPSPLKDCVHRFLFHLPRNWRDLRTLIGRICSRISR